MVELAALRQGPLDRLPAAVAGAAAALSVALRRARSSFLRCRIGRGRRSGKALRCCVAGRACRAATSRRPRGAVAWARTNGCCSPRQDDAEAITRQFAAAADTHACADRCQSSQLRHRRGGRRAAELINYGCALDLRADAFPSGMCTRTLFEKSEIILWRVDSHTYHVEIERSFAPYVWTMLIEMREESHDPA